MNHIDDIQITRWALAAGQGDRAAAATFVEATYRQVWRFLAHLAGPANAEDLTQETYLRAFHSLSRFAGRSSARTWLLAIARRVAVDQIRTATVRPRVVALTDWEEAADARQRRGGPRFEDAVLIHHLINDLPVPQREAFVVTQLLGMSYEEAAKICDCPIGTIRSRVARARDDLINILRKDDRPGPDQTATRR